VKQCKKCPWRKGVNPHDIPDGYCEVKHAALESTIAKGLNLGPTLHLMACHESPVGDERPCIGWLYHQLGEGNNIGLRLWAIKNLRESLDIVGDQHETFEETLPSR
jgi:hypothetical protein